MNMEANTSNNISKFILSNGLDKIALENIIRDICSEEPNANHDIISFLSQQLKDKTNLEIILDFIDFLVNYGTDTTVELIAKKEFLDQILQLLKKSSKTDINIQKKVVFLIQKWAKKYENEKNRKFFIFVENYNFLKSQNMKFPPLNYNLETYSKFISDEEAQNLLIKAEEQIKKEFSNPFSESPNQDEGQGNKNIINDNNIRGKQQINKEEEEEENPYKENNNNIGAQGQNEEERKYPKFPSRFGNTVNNNNIRNNPKMNNNINMNNNNQRFQNDMRRNTMNQMQNNNNANNNNNYYRTNRANTLNNNNCTFAFQNNDTFDIISFKRTVGNRLLQLNRWIDDGKFSFNSGKLKDGMRQILKEIQKCEYMMRRSELSNDKRGYEVARNMRMDMEQTCARYEALMNDRRVEPFCSSFTGNSRQYYYNVNEMFGIQNNNNNNMPMNDFDNYYQNQGRGGNNNYNNNYNQYNNDYDNYGMQNNYEEKGSSFGDKLNQFGNDVKEGLSTVGDKIKSGFNYVKGKFQ